MFLKKIGFLCFFLIISFYCGQPSFAVQQKKPKLVNDPIFGDIIPQECMVYARWSSYENLDPENSPTERWLSRPEIQKSYQLFLSKLEKSQSNWIKKINKHVNQTKSDPSYENGFFFGRGLFEEAGMVVLFSDGFQKVQIPNGTVYDGMLYTEEDPVKYDPEDEDHNVIVEEMKNSGVLVLNITKRRKRYETWIQSTIKNQKVPQKKINGVTFHDISKTKYFLDATKENEQEHRIILKAPNRKGAEKVNDEQPPLWVGLGKNHFYCFINDGDKKLLASKDKPNPLWFKTLIKRQTENTSSFLGYIDFRPMIHSFGTYPFVKNGLSFSGLSELKEGYLTMGLGAKGTVTRFKIDFGTTPKGLLGILGANKSVKKSDFDFINPKTHHVIAAKLDWSMLPDNLFATRDQSNQDKSRDELFEEWEIRSGVNPDKFFPTLDHDVLATGSVTAPLPYASWTFHNKIKDSKKFAPQFESYFEAIESSDEHQFIRVKERKVKGQNVFSHNSYFLPQVYYTHNEKKVTVGFNNRTVAKLVNQNKKFENDHLAKAAKTGGKTNLSVLWEKGVAPTNSRLVAAGRFDLAPALKVAIPLLKTMFSGQDWIPGIEDYSVSDLPNTKTLIEGVDPIIVGVFRTKNGFEIYSQQTLPQFRPNDFLLVSTLTNYIQMASFAKMMGRHQHEHEDSTDSSAQYFMRHRWELQQGFSDYRSENGAFPSTHTENAKGNPLLSWRVHMLPYLNQGDLYDQFHLDEPWDSEHNKKLLKKMPEIYSISEKPNKNGLTRILAVTGKDTLFRSPIEKYFDCPDGFDESDYERLKKSVPILVVGNKENAVPWTAPGDWNCDEKDAQNRLFSVKKDEKKDEQIYFFITPGEVKNYPAKRFWKRINGKFKVQLKSLDEIEKEGKEPRRINGIRF